MPNQLVRALGPLVTQPAFRTDAARFLSLPSCSVNRLVSLVEEHATFNVPPGDLHEFEMACNLKGQGRQVLAAARVIRSAVEGIDQKELRDRALTDFASQLEVERMEKTLQAIRDRFGDQIIAGNEE